MKKVFWVFGSIAIFFLFLAAFAFAVEGQCVTYQEARQNPALKGQTDSQLRAMGFCPGTENTTTSEATPVNPTPIYPTPITETAVTSASTAETPVIASETPEQISTPSTTGAAVPTETANWFDLVNAALYSIPSPSSQFDEAYAIYINYKKEDDKDWADNFNASFDQTELNKCLDDCAAKFPTTNVDPDTFYQNFYAVRDCKDKICFANEKARTDKLFTELKERQKARAQKAIAAINAIKDRAGRNEPPSPNLSQTPAESSGESVSDTLMNIIAAAQAHEDELISIETYYSWPDTASGKVVPTEDDLKKQEDAKKKFDDTRPLGSQVVSAKGDYEEAFRKGASREELAALKDRYDQKLQQLKDALKNNVLSMDGTNFEALWQLGTLSKWEGNDWQSYLYYRDALKQMQHQNVFQYQRLIDSFEDSKVKENLLQGLAPDEKISSIPTIDTSPFLKGLKGNLNTLVKPVDEKLMSLASDMEQMSRSFSMSDAYSYANEEMNAANDEFWNFVWDWKAWEK